MGDESIQGRLLSHASPTEEEKDEERLIAKAINKAMRSASDVSNLLPASTVLIFQFLSPVVSNNGSCGAVDTAMTASLIALCGLICFALSFTDTVRASDGKLHYGIVTTKGLWAPQLTPGIFDDRPCYRLRVIDVFHATVSVLVFAAFSLFTANVKSCFYPSLDSHLQVSIPLCLGFLASFLFIMFPSNRRSLDFPIIDIEDGSDPKKPNALPYVDSSLDQN